MKAGSPSSALRYTQLLTSSSPKPSRADSWNHANALRNLGMHADAARAFLEAVPRLAGEVQLSLPVQTAEVAVGAVCLVKWGKKYGPEYVNRLARALRRHGGGGDVRVVCFTDDGEGVHDALVEVRGLPKEGRFRGWEGWWYKSYLFSEEATRVLGEGGGGGEWAAYVDLDTVVMGRPTWEPGEGKRDFNALRTDGMVNECKR